MIARPAIHLGMVVLTNLTFLAAPVTFAEAAKSEFSLVSAKGEAITIVAPEDRGFDSAIKELTEHLRKITGKDFPVIRGKSPKGTVLELLVDEKLGADKAGGFELLVTPEKIRIAGADLDGVSNGVSEVLEQLGVRWFIPGELGTVIPESRKPTLPAQSISQVPSFPSRYYQGLRGKEAPQWSKRLRMGGGAFNGAHGIRFPKEVTIKTNPELYALYKGERSKRQVCVSNPDVLKLAVQEARKYFDANPTAVVYGMGPNDGAGFCECEGCVALDSGEWDSFSAEPSHTDRYIWFFNRVLEEVDKTHPGKKIGFYIYHSYMLPPKNVKPNPRIVGALAPIALCRVHGMNNPVCPDRSYYRDLMEQWSRILPEVYERGYWFNLADPGLPFISVHRMRDEIPQARKFGIKGWRSESISNWASELPSLYIGAKLMWDTSVDVDALMDDFSDKFFGPAAKPMKTYFQTLDQALRDGDHHAGASFETPHVYTPEVLKKAGAAISEARALAKEEPYAARVKLIGLTFEYLENFIQMQESRNAFQWDQAVKNLTRIDEIVAELTAYEPKMINERSTPEYLSRFYRKPVEEGFERSRNGNEVVAQLSGEWDFLLDTAKVGEVIGLWKPGLTGGRWQKISAYDTTWSDNGLHYYRGLAWYRQKFEVDKKWTGKRVFLWFGGVDESAKVWVNGVQVGISPGAAFYPFELDITSALRPGQMNEIVVCVANLRTDELGTGGITAPVMLYAPKDGDKAETRNIRPLRDTFP